MVHVNKNGTKPKWMMKPLFKKKSKTVEWNSHRGCMGWVNAWVWPVSEKYENCTSGIIK